MKKKNHCFSYSINSLLASTLRFGPRSIPNQTLHLSNSHELCDMKFMHVFILSSHSYISFISIDFYVNLCIDILKVPAGQEPLPLRRDVWQHANGQGGGGRQCGEHKQNAVIQSRLQSPSKEKRLYIWMKMATHAARRCKHFGGARARGIKTLGQDWPLWHSL